MAEEMFELDVVQKMVYGEAHRIGLKNHEDLDDMVSNVVLDVAAARLAGRASRVSARVLRMKLFSEIRAIKKRDTAVEGDTLDFLSDTNGEVADWVDPGKKDLLERLKRTYDMAGGWTDTFEVLLDRTLDHVAATPPLNRRELESLDRVEDRLDLLFEKVPGATSWSRREISLAVCSPVTTVVAAMEKMQLHAEISVASKDPWRTRGTVKKQIACLLHHEPEARDWSYQNIAKAIGRPRETVCRYVKQHGLPEPQELVHVTKYAACLDYTRPIDRVNKLFEIEPKAKEWSKAEIGRAVGMVTETIIRLKGVPELDNRPRWKKAPRPDPAPYAYCRAHKTTNRRLQHLFHRNPETRDWPNATLAHVIGRAHVLAENRKAALDALSQD